MLRRFLVLGVGALALVVVLGAPGQVHAQRMRGGIANGVHPGFHGGFTPGFNRGVFGPPFGPGPRRIFDPASTTSRIASRTASTAGSWIRASVRDSAQASFVRFDGLSRQTTG